MAFRSAHCETGSKESGARCHDLPKGHQGGSEKDRKDFRNGLSGCLGSLHIDEFEAPFNAV